MTQEKKDQMLEEAVWVNDVNSVVRALELGSDPNIKDRVIVPLAMACGNGSCEIADALINAGAELNYIQDYNGWTPFMYAADTGKMDVMDVLIEAGADTEIKSKQGNTALDILKEKHPDRYSIWANKAVLAHEDAAAAGDVCGGPDFSL